MDPLRNPDVPSSAKALSLVRAHHRLPGAAAGLEPTSSDRGKVGRRPRWRREARRNHLRATRRTVALEGIRGTSLPVILEIEGGSRVVILKERVGGAGFLVQFPDGRESFVAAERLGEVYTGHCVFLHPREGSRSDSDRGGPERLGRWTRRVGALLSRFRGAKWNGSAEAFSPARGRLAKAG